MSEDDFFAAPAFNVDEALQRARRELRGLGLVEREGRFDRGAHSIARVAIDEAALPEVDRRPARLRRRAEATPRPMERP